MLVLSRKTNERIVIGEGVEIVIIGVQGQRVRLGVTAPADLRIRRPECAPINLLQPASRIPLEHALCQDD